MRYLRMLTNSLLAGALGAGFVGVLILQLNPHLPLSLPVLLALGQRLLVFYGINLAVGFYALIVLAQLLTRDGLSPGWLSLRLLAWSSTLVAGAAAALMWLNLRGYRLVVTEEAGRRMAAGAAATAVCALLLLIIAVVHYSFGRRGSRVGGTLYALTVVAALGLPVVARGRGEPIEHPHRDASAVPALADGIAGRLTLILLDGASLEFITPITAAGRLPHFARLLEEGAALHLSTMRPTQPGPVWAAVATGMYPPRNGVRASERYRFGAGDEEMTLLPDLCLAHALVTYGIVEALPQDASAFRARPLWRVLSDVGVSVGVAGVPLTHPAAPVTGYLVSDRLHLLASATLPYRETDLVFPHDALAGLPDEAFRLPLSTPGTLPGQGPLPRDVFYRELAATLDARVAPTVRIIRYEGIDVTGHHYLRYVMPGAFGDVSAGERQRLGQVLEQQYALFDAEIGAEMEALGPDDLLMVVSAFGMQPQSPGKRLLAEVLREPDLSGTHERAPDGFLLAWGANVAAGRVPVGAIVDVTPTILYYLGLPVARDMDGDPRTDLFKDTFTADRTVTYIPSYGS
jgi:hypothetical protein